MGKKFDPATDIASLAGKVILVTGGNAGLGKQTIAYLAAHSPARIYLAARTESKATAAINDLKSSNPDAPIEYLNCDLTSFSSISSAASTFLSRESRLDLLINNAGVMMTPYSLTKEGYENQFGTNHVGHALLTKLLMPTLLKTADAGNDVRIVNVSSMAHRMAPKGGIVFDMKDLENRYTTTRYGHSKVANILFTRELAHRYPSVTSVSIHPGVIITDLYASVNSNRLMSFGIWIWGTFFSWLPGNFPDTKGGALTQTWAATADKKELENGAFYEPVGKVGRGSAYARDDGLAKKLWEWTEEEFAKHGF